ncbi:peroxiredoxin [Luteibacter sp. RCC_6_2]|jgi:peroxiredoxin (alkyl hydroperoxide reductase subunit C)|uniref:peroxiredoxin n=1 Tax=Luteibacter sp. RCC_6_2 TaxID=3239223 RepID=UPI0035256B2A
MLSIGDKFPQFNLKAVAGGPLANKIEDAFVDVTDKSYEGKWKLVFSYPKDFTFVCPTEIKGFSDLNEKFADRDCQILAVSTDSEFVHRAWRMDHADLKDLSFPMLADIKKDLCAALGILTDEGVAQRATFLVDPNNEIQFVYVTAGSVGRNPDEVLRVLDALQTDELCACNWKSGDETLKVA